MIFSDLDLARRLEGLEAWCGSECARARMRMQPEADTAALPVAGGYAFFFGAASPLTEAKGLGMSGPVTDEELEAMECVFSGRGIPAKVMLCPMADPSLLAGLTRRDYQPSGFENVLYRALDRFETFPTPRAIAAEWAGPDEVELCGQTLARGFVAPDEPGPEILEITAMAMQVEGMRSVLARVDGEPAGAASLLVRDGVAMLAGASTLPDYRRRGIQTTLAYMRLDYAAAAGCQLATMGASPGSTSQRNAERLGFRVAYTKLVLVREFS
ncbi:MAG: GNAT family N-acetyltransferase [Isosphaeraceae bacterium]